MWERLKAIWTVMTALLAEQGRALGLLAGAAVLVGAMWCLVRAIVGRIWGRRGLVCLRRWLLVLAAAALIGRGGRALWPRVSGWLPAVGSNAPAEDWFGTLALRTLPDDAVEPLQAKAALLVDLTHGQILYRSGFTDRIAPASTTKLLTALTVWQLCGPEEWVTVGEEQSRVAFDASRAGLQQGDALTVRQMTAAMLLPSGNDAAYALAAHAGRVLAGADCTTGQALEAFRAAMNDTAQALGAEKSRFVTPDGYDAEGHYTTVQDLACIARAFWQNEDLAALAGAAEYTVTFADGHTAVYQTTDLLLLPDSEWYTPAATGGKTGRSSTAGGCLVTMAEADGVQYLCIVMGSSETGRWTDTRALLAAVER